MYEDEKPLPGCTPEYCAKAEPENKEQPTKPQKSETEIINALIEKDQNEPVTPKKP